jgi:hypothetical protein
LSHCPKNAALDDAEEHGIRIVLYVVAECEVEFPSAIELVIPGERQRIRVAGDVDL